MTEDAFMAFCAAVAEITGPDQDLAREAFKVRAMIQADEAAIAELRTRNGKMVRALRYRTRELEQLEREVTGYAPERTDSLADAFEELHRRWEYGQS